MPQPEIVRFRAIWREELLPTPPRRLPLLRPAARRLVPLGRGDHIRLMGLRVSEMPSILVGQVYQYGRVVDEVSIDRKYMKGGKAAKASGRILPIFAATKPHILAWLQRLAAMLKVADISDIPSETPLFMSRVRNPDGSRRAIARETAWRIIKAIARENGLPGAVGTHSTRKTLARKAMAWSKDIRVVQKLLGHKSLQSTEAYLKSLTDREVWSAFQTAMVAA
jgi:site-specific recombinase XerD